MADLSTRGNFARHKNCPLYPIFMPKFEPEMIRVFLSGKSGLSRKAGFSGKAGISDPSVPSPMESRECALGYPSHGTARRIDLPDGNVAARPAGSGPALASAIGVCTPKTLGGCITAQGHLLEVGA